MNSFTRVIIISLTLFSIFLIVDNIVLKRNLKKSEEIIANMKSEYEEQILICEQKMSDAISEWDMFTLALMKVESNYNPTAVSSVGARGYFQITPIYVAEVNRIHKTNYVFEEVVASFEKSYEVFTLMQEAHNNEYCMDKALKLHNGNHKWYHRRVYKEMENIKRYEMMRQMVREKRVEMNMLIDNMQ